MIKTLTEAEIAQVLATTDRGTLRKKTTTGGGGAYRNMSRQRVERSRKGRTWNYGRSIKFVDQEWADNFARQLKGAK